MPSAKSDVKLILMTTKNLYAINVPREFSQETRFFDFALVRNGKLMSLKSTANPDKAWSTADLDVAKQMADELNKLDNRSGSNACSVVPWRGNVNNPMARTEGK